jgi:hypothetical protein
MYVPALSQYDFFCNWKAWHVRQLQAPLLCLSLPLQARLQSGRFHPCPHSKHGQSPADSGSRRDNQDSLVLDAMFCRGLETLNRRLVNGLLMLFCSLGGE